MQNSQRIAVTGLVAVAVLLTAGLGFAQFTTSGSISGNAQSGSFGLIVTYLAVGPGTPAYISFGGPPTGIGTDYVTFSIGLFGPGDVAYLTYTVMNTGTLTVPNPNLVVSTTSTNLCDSLFSAGATGAPTSLAGGASFTATMTISEEVSPPPACAGASATVTLTVMGTT